MALCTLVYYAGEIVDCLGWTAVRWDFFYSVHDVHRLLFFAPILYAAYVFGTRAAVISSLVSGGIWTPRALFISPYPSPELRAGMFLVVMGCVGYLLALALHRGRQIEKMNHRIAAERDMVRGILERLSEGVAIIGPDYAVRFANEKLKGKFGEAGGRPCYKYIFGRPEPCEKCRLRDVVSGTAASWKARTPGGQTYEFVATPYMDADNLTCQLVLLKDTTARAASAMSSNA
jgi:hypothetical protein